MWLDWLFCTCKGKSPRSAPWTPSSLWTKQNLLLPPRAVALQPSQRGSGQARPAERLLRHPQHQPHRREPPAPHDGTNTPKQREVETRAISEETAALYLLQDFRWEHPVKLGLADKLLSKFHPILTGDYPDQVNTMPVVPGEAAECSHVRQVTLLLL